MARNDSSPRSRGNPGKSTKIGSKKRLRLNGEPPIGHTEQGGWLALPDRLTVRKWKKLKPKKETDGEEGRRRKEEEAAEQRSGDGPMLNS